MMTIVLTLVCMAALYFIHLYWVSREIAAQTQKVLHHLAATDAKLDKLLSSTVRDFLTVRSDGDVAFLQVL